MYFLSYHVNPRSPIPRPPNIDERLIVVFNIVDLPLNVSLAASAVVAQAWLTTSIRNTRMPHANALRKPFFI
jgi:hypothetical protein